MLLNDTSRCAADKPGGEERTKADVRKTSSKENI